MTLKLWEQFYSRPIPYHLVFLLIANYLGQYRFREIILVFSFESYLAFIPYLFKFGIVRRFRTVVHHPWD